jgi:hypothetical protein
MPDVDPIIAQIVPALAKAFKDDVLLRDFFTEVALFVHSKHDGTTLDDTKMVRVPVNVPHAAMDYLESVAVPEGCTKEQLLGETIAMLMRFGLSFMIHRSVQRTIVSGLVNAYETMGGGDMNPGGGDDDSGTLQ